MNKVKPLNAWGIVSQNGHGKFGLTYALKSTRAELYERYPWIKNKGTYKVVRVRVTVGKKDG